MSSRFSRLTALLLFGAVTACSAGSPPSTAASSTTGIESLKLPSGEHMIRAGGRVIRFGGTQKHRNAHRSWISPDMKKKKTALLYGSSYDGGFINIYDEKGTGQSPVGQLTNGLLTPQGIVVDKHHQLWVANTNAFSVVAFKRGATTPFTTLNDPGYYPIGVAVDSKGTVYAANAEGTYGPPGNVTFWKKGSVDPSGTLSFGDFLIVLGIGVDGNDNVYVSYIPTSGPPAVVEFPAGSQTGQLLPITGTTISDITFDSSADLVMEDEYNQLGIWPAPYSGGPSQSLLIFGNEPTLNKKENEVWIAYANFSTPKIEGYSYPGGALLDTITAGFTDSAVPYGVAVDPYARP